MPLPGPFVSPGGEHVRAAKVSYETGEREELGDYNDYNDYIDTRH